MLDRVTRLTEEFFATVEDDGVTQAQREALIDLLIWTMYSDNSIKVEETAKLDAVLASLTWEAPLQVNQYLGMAYSRIRTALDVSDEQARLLESVRERLGNDDMRAKALGFARDLASSDGEVNEAEEGFLGTIRAAFGSG